MPEPKSFLIKCKEFTTKTLKYIPLCYCQTGYDISLTVNPYHKRRQYGNHMVIPHHQDDFFPPISTYVDIRPFIKGVKRTCPDTTIRIMQINETITI